MCNKCGGRGALESTSVAVVSTNMQITTIPLQAYKDYEFYGLDLCLSFPAHSGTEPVYIFDGANSYPLFDTNGQPVVSGRMRGHARYRIRWGAGGVFPGGVMPPHFTIYNGLCSMQYSANAALQAMAAEG